MVTEYCSCCAERVWEKARRVKLPKKQLGKLVHNLTAKRTGDPGTPGYFDRTTWVTQYCHSCGTGAAYEGCSNCEHETSSEWIPGIPAQWEYHNHICVCEGDKTFTKEENKKFRRFMLKHCSA